MWQWMHDGECAMKTRESMDARTAGLKHCPACLSARIVAVGDGAGINFFCEDCMRCWHETMGWLELIDPRSCIDCPRKRECVTALAPRAH